MTLRGGVAARATSGGRLQRFLPSLPIAGAAGLFAVATGRVEVPLAIALFALLVGLFAGRITLAPILELAATGTLAIFAIPLAGLVEPEPGRLAGVVSIVAVPGALGLLLVASARRALASPRGGEPATQALVAFVVLLAGAGTLGVTYVLLSAPLLLAASLTLRAQDPARRGAWPGRRALLAGVVVLAAGALGTTAAGVLLPLAARDVGQWVVEWLEPPVQVGFSASAIRLGVLRDVYQSPREVLRVEGVPAGALLRGASFERYERGVWLTGERRFEAEAPPVRGSPGTLERLASPPLPLFLPRGAAPLQGARGVRRDERGIWEQGSIGTWDEVTFLVGGDRPLAPPGFDALQLPRAIAPQLEAIGAELAAGAGPPAAKLRGIVGALETRFAYSIEVPSPGRQDPVIAFLTESRRGHCELFASALTLLLRAQGIPARIVTGYRVTEELGGGGFLVRERNAHAWVEAWVDGRWEEVDPSPVEALEALQPSEAPAAATLSALLSRALRATLRFLQARSSTQWAALAALLTAGLVLAQRLRRRRTSVSLDPLAPDAPDALVAALLAQLAARGHTRGATEPLERFAERLVLPDPEGARLVAAWAAWRYGGEGDRETWARSVRARLDGTSAGTKLSERS